MSNWVVLRGFAMLLGILLLVSILQKLINKPFNEFHLPEIAFEWEREPGQINKIIEAKKAEGGNFLTELNIDTFLFIPIYTILFIYLAFYLRASDLAAGNRYFYAIIVCILTAAIFDWTENYFMYRIINQGVSTELASYKYYACYIKWSLIALAVFIISLSFFSLGNLWVAVPGFAAFAIFVIGILFTRPLIQWGFGMLGFVLVMIAIFL
jgi:hypothetical protein